MGDSGRTKLEEERDQALSDLRDLESQVAAGEIEPNVATELRARYEAAAADAMHAMDTWAAEQPSGRSRRRMILGAGAFLVIAAVVTVTLVNAVESRPEGGFVTGGVASDALEETPLDLSTVSNEEMEQVVAANPDVIPMRLALARRYVEKGEFSTALPHYMYVLEQETNPEALMYVGWMTYVSGDAATGIALLEESLEIRPDEPLAEWFIANALFYGANDASRAERYLRSVIESGDAPDEIVADAERMLEESAP